MALYDDNEKYLFSHLYKCGGNSLRQVLDMHSLTKLGYDFGAMSKSDIREAKEISATFGEIHGVHCHARDVQAHYIGQGKEELFNEMYNSTSGEGKKRIEFDNWKQADKIWNRRFPENMGLIARTEAENFNN